MKKAVLYLMFGTVISFVLNYFLLGSQGWALDLFYAVAFGAAWGIAYYLDTPEISLPKKLGFSFVAMAIIVGIGTLIFNLELAIPSVIKFSIVFVAYYLLASFKASKSLRR